MRLQPGRRLAVDKNRGNRYKTLDLYQLLKVEGPTLALGEDCLTTAILAEPATGFSTLNLNSAILDALQHAKYFTPTPIQAALIPHALEGRDVIGQAQTGTGKTAAFLLPSLNSWREDEETPGPHALVLAPTRELVP